MKIQILNILYILLLICSSCQQKEPTDSLKTVFETSSGTKTATYTEGIRFWEQLDKNYKGLNLIDFGETDAGYPLHLAILSSNECNIYNLQTRKDKALLFINNGIHPGEPDGVDASMMLFRDILKSKNRDEILKNVIVAAIPFYNIGGALNRNSNSRANQNGPEEYGFRGNAQNLDLNRDFIKCDSKNAKSFAKLMHLIDPDLYVETHVSNGADYQYTMTYLPTHPDKLGKHLGKEMTDKLLPYLKNEMIEKKFPMSPYVDLAKNIPDSGIVSFYDSPRYSTGYLATLAIPCFITETHMLKPYKERVWSTYHFLNACVSYFEDVSRKNSIVNAKAEERNAISSESYYTIDWELDMDQFDTISFTGYESGYKESLVSGAMRLYYDTNQPFTRDIRYYSHLKPSIDIHKPKAYILKRGFHKVEELLRLNNIKLNELERDSSIRVIRSKIDTFSTTRGPYEGHYMHFATRSIEDTMEMTFKKGDYIIRTGTEEDRFLMSVLEAEGPDSYFNWNFFDAVIQMKEWYSPYVFEDKAAEYLETIPGLKEEFVKELSSNINMQNNPRAQLQWIFTHSPHYEKEHLILPVFKML